MYESLFWKKFDVRPRTASSIIMIVGCLTLPLVYVEDTITQY